MTGADSAGMIGPAGTACPDSDPGRLRGGQPPAPASPGEEQARARATRSGTRDEAASWAGQGLAADLPEPAVPPAAGERVVLHVDIDAFFAAIEQLRDPRLKGRPVIVGAGVIASCSYEARRFRLKAGMPLSEARRLCPQVVIVDGHAQVYRCFAEQVFAVCREFSPAVETFLDEAYCELTGTERLHGDPLAAAARLKQRIRSATQLTVSCGLGPNRMLAKLAGKLRRPDGLARVRAHEADAFLAPRPIEDLAGVGHTHAKTLRSMNVTTIGALRVLPVEALAALFGAPGRLLYERCRGRDTAVVSAREIPLTLSRETSLHRPTADRGEIEGMLEYLLGRAARAARELGVKPRTIAVRLRYGDGESDERSRTLALPSDVDPVLLAPALDLLRLSFTRRVPLHLVGVTLSNFAAGLAEQGSLLDEREAGRRSALMRAFDGLRDAFGHGVLVSGRALHLKNQLAEDRHGFVLRTPSLTK